METSGLLPGRGLLQGKKAAEMAAFFYYLQSKP
jgi:hypothetical protein